MDSPLDRLDIADPGDWVKARCEEIGVPLRQVLREARVAPSTVWRWSSGDYQPAWGSFNRIRGVLKSYWDRQRDDR